MVWMYHRDFPDGRLFDRPEDAPKGSVDSPAKIKPLGRPKNDNDS